MKLTTTLKLSLFSCFFLLLTSCQKEITDQILDSGRVDNNTSFIKCKIDGVDKTFNVSVSGFNTNGLGFYSFGITGKASNDPANFEEIEMGVDGLAPITTGTYSEDNLSTFIISADYSPNDPVNIFSANFTAAPQVPFSITINSIDSTRVTGIFQGNLYDSSGTGSTITSITAGEFDVPF